MKKKTMTSILAAAGLLAAGAVYAGPGGGMAKTDQDATTKFMHEAAMGGMYEVQAAELVEERTDHDGVENLAETIEKDHARANEKLKEIAKQMNVELPNQLDREHVQALEQLRKADREQLDKQYVDKMIADHEKDIAKFEKAQKQIQVTELSNWIDETLPVLKKHLELAKRVQRDVGSVAQRQDRPAQRDGR